MQWLLLAGGAPSFVILIFGLLAIAAAIGFAISPTIHKLPRIGALCAAVFFATVCGVAADLAAVSNHVADNEASQKDLALTLMVGIGESLAPAILGMAFLSIVALVAAIGFGRLQRVSV